MRVDVIRNSSMRVFSTSISNSSYFYGGFGFAVLFATQSTHFNTKSKGFLVNGDLDYNGERPCQHYKLEGSAIALPRSLASSELRQIKMTDDPTMPLRSQVVTIMKNGAYNVKGPVFLFGENKIYRAIIPDLSGTTRKTKNFNVEIIISGNFITYSIKGQIAQAPLFKWTDVDHYSVYEFNTLTGKYRVDSGVWRNLDYMTAHTNATFSPSIFPTTYRGMEYIGDRLARSYHTPPHSDILGDLVRRCANDTQTIPVNSIGLVIELRRISETLRAALNLRKGKVDAKKIASAYLQYKYGLRLTAMDLNTVAKGIMKRVAETRKGQSRSRAMSKFFPKAKEWVPASSNCVVEYYYKIHYRTYSDTFLDVLKTWMDSGLFPSLTNAWDLIPLSFVIDWFFRVEDYLNAIDANTYWSTHSITGVVYTTKSIYSDVSWIFNTDPGFTLTGDMRFVFYDRRLSPTVHTPTFFEPSPHVFTNYAELSALIIANKR